LIFIHALILAILIEAIACLTNALNPPEIAVLLSKDWHAIIILIDTVFYTLNMRSTFLIACARAFFSVLVAYQPLENVPVDTRIVLRYTLIHAVLAETSATTIIARYFIFQTSFWIHNEIACILFVPAIVQTRLALLGNRSGYQK
jgi:hypothetical protein